jgi:DNA invertase Pin-like site-specific DNA recombinase
LVYFEGVFSTDRQAVDMQLVELREYVKRTGFATNTLSVYNNKRPAFLEMIAGSRKKKCDILLVWKLDRLGSLGIDFSSYKNQLNTFTPTGKLVFHIVGAVAEFEKDIIRERIKAGLENARRKGKRLSRTPISESIIKKTKALREQGLSYRKIGNV